MRFASLGSGSRGNGTLIEQGNTCVLVDCGFSTREAEKRLERLGKSAHEITAVLVTHEHSDHIGGVGSLARKYDLPVWATSGTLFVDRQAERDNFAERIGEGVDLNPICSHTVIAIGDIEIQPFPVPHDAREPSQFVFSNGNRRLGLLTDTGSYTPHIEEQLSGCDALILECNHETTWLEQGEYPPALKQRVGGKLGHLSNRQAADILSRLDYSRLNCIVAAHLSEKHNTPLMAQQALSAVLGCETDWISVAYQQTGFAWRDV